MHETYRMLGQGHEADLEREAARCRRATEVRGRRRADVARSLTGTREKPVRFSRTLLSFLTRAARSAS
jgi:hypothetical protein